MQRRVRQYAASSGSGSRAAQRGRRGQPAAPPLTSMKLELSLWSCATTLSASWLLPPLAQAKTCFRAAPGEAKQASRGASSSSSERAMMFREHRPARLRTLARAAAAAHRPAPLPCCDHRVGEALRARPGEGNGARVAAAAGADSDSARCTPPDSTLALRSIFRSLPCP